jgi:hypothetical protein
LDLDTPIVSPLRATAQEGTLLDPKQTLRRLEFAAAKALARLKRYPEYAAIHLQVIEECEQLFNTVGPTLPKPALPSRERLKYAIDALDIWAGGYLKLISTLADHEDFVTILRSYERKTWNVYRGDVEIEPFGANPQLAIIQNRCLHWYKASLRQVASKSTPDLTTKPAAKRVGYRKHIRAWMKNEKLESVKAAAKKLAVSESTLKSIMSDKGELRCSEETLGNVLKKTGYVGE